MWSDEVGLFPWGYIINPLSIPELKDKSLRIIGVIEPPVYQNFLHNFNNRVVGAFYTKFQEDLQLKRQLVVFGPNSFNTPK